ncbi:MAG: NAD(P)-dependent oxidoreductase [Gemmatimonadales bacterium]|jgi:3-hydroxyisobutyrate dehydrogenase-like beta-hydroxyacid dehydrogenase|nr:NAD(P)-dependent oxidoreductase [Gemmatimonadales bacterium]
MRPASLHTIAVVGLGQMGRPIAANLVAAGFAVRTCNRSGGAVDGATAAPTIARAVSGADVAVTMLSEDAAVEAVTFGDGGLLASLDAGALHLGMSTISVALAGRLAEAHAAAGQAFVAAPVFGRPEAAAARQLWIVPGGEPAHLDRLAPVFAAVGQGTWPMPGAREAALAKLCGNFMLAGTIELLGEALVLGEKGGIAPAALLDMLTGTLFTNPVSKRYGQMIATGVYQPAGFAMPLGLKDMRLVLQAGDDSRTPLPLAELLRSRFLEALARGRGDWDWAGIASVARDAAGLGNPGDR